MIKLLKKILFYIFKDELRLEFYLRNLETHKNSIKQTSSVSHMQGGTGIASIQGNALIATKPTYRALELYQRAIKKVNDPHIFLIKKPLIDDNDKMDASFSHSLHHIRPTMPGYPYDMEEFWKVFEEIRESLVKGGGL